MPRGADRAVAWVLDPCRTDLEERMGGAWPSRRKPVFARDQKNALPREFDCPLSISGVRFFLHGEPRSEETEVLLQPATTHSAAEPCTGSVGGSERSIRRAAGRRRSPREGLGGSRRMSTSQIGTARVTSAGRPLRPGSFQSNARSQTGDVVAGNARVRPPGSRSGPGIGFRSESSHRVVGVWRSTGSPERYWAASVHMQPG